MLNNHQLETVGRTRLKVPKLGLGTAPLGNLYRNISEATAVETVLFALSKGIDFFDTAPYYGSGLAEHRLGIAFKGVLRQNYILATKVGRLLQTDGSFVYDFSRDGILRSIEGSLTRLQISRLDIVHIHDPLPQHYLQVVEEAFPTLVELRSQGVIGAIGAGMNEWQMLTLFARAADFDCFLLAGRYTLLEQEALKEFLPLCQQQNISVFLGGVYNSGILATGAVQGAKYNYEEAPPAILERVRQIEAICQDYGVALNVAALQFPMGHPAVTSLIIGAENPGEVAANLEALQKPIPSSLWARLKSAGLLQLEAPVPT